MRERKNIIDYLAQVVHIFGIMMLVLMVLTFVFGDSAMSISKMFTIGSQGISVGVMAQFFLLSILVAGLRYLFFTDRLVKQLSIILRIVFMLLSIIAVIAIFIYCFEWFPMNMWEPWVMFFLCFAICVGVSAAVTTIRVKLEDKKMEAGLDRLKRKLEDEENV